MKHWEDCAVFFLGETPNEITGNYFLEGGTRYRRTYLFSEKPTYTQK